MDPSFLEDYESKELERSDKIGHEMLRLVEKHPEIAVDPLDYLPEWRNKLEGKAYASALPFRGMYTQLPFHDILLVQIPPLRSPSAFVQLFGLTAEQLFEQWRQGKLLVALSFYPTAYEGLEYLDLFLERQPPCILSRQENIDTATLFARTGKHWWQIDRFDDSMVRALKTFDEVLLPGLTWDSAFIQAFQFLLDLGPRHVQRLATDPKLWLEGLNQTQNALRTLYGFHYANLRSIGYSDLADGLLVSAGSQGSLLSVGQMMAFGEVLWSIPWRGIGGVLSLTNGELLALKDIASHEVAPNMTSTRTFPVDVSQLLVKELKLVDLCDIGFETVLEIYPNTHKARRALWELDHAVRERQDMIPDRAIALQEIWKETNQAVTGMIKQRQRLAFSIPVIMGMIGAAVGGLVSQLGILAGVLGGALSGLSIGDQLANQLISFCKPPQVVAVYDLAKHETPQD